MIAYANALRRFTFAVADEGEDVVACAGAWLGGKKPALIIADSGFLVAIWPLGSLAASGGDILQRISRKKFLRSETAVG